MSEPSENSYFGADLSWEEYDERMIRINKDWVEEERSLFICKWFDYRQMHPVQATYLYADEYIKAFRNHYARNYDRAATEGGRPIRPWRQEDIFEDGPPQNADLKALRIRVLNAQRAGNEEKVAAANDKLATLEKKAIKQRKFALSGLWRGRMVADMMGMPYPIFLDYAFEVRLRRWGRPTMPPPNALYEFGVAIDLIDAKWTERQTAAVDTAQSAFYRNESYSGLKAQDDHHEWLFALAHKRENPSPLLARFLNENLLTKAKIESRLGTEGLERVLAYT